MKKKKSKLPIKFWVGLLLLFILAMGSYLSFYSGNQYFHDLFQSLLGGVFGWYFVGAILFGGGVTLLVKGIRQIKKGVK